MTEKKSKNDLAWDKIFAELEIIEKIEKDGFFQISSAQINKYREARLMTKFDHAVQLPKIFQKNKLSIQPVSRGGYVIGSFKSYFNLSKKKLSDIIYLDFPFQTETINPNNIYSESSAILCAFLSGMIDDVVGEETKFTVFGRMSTGKFSYQIEDTLNEKTQTVNVKNSQCEIDGGFEGESKFAIIEAKCESVDDFIIRQLYYPYRLWKSKTSKEVIPIFLSVSNDIFSFYIFRFSDVNGYNSIELVSTHRYCLSHSEIQVSDIRKILETVEIVPKPKKIPFPQADSFFRIIDLLGKLYNANEPISKEEITLNYAFNVRQTDYYVSAAIYLGLIEKEQSKTRDITYVLSKKGLSIISQHPQKRNLELVRCILCHKTFNLSLREYLNQSRTPTLENVVAIIRQDSENPAEYADTTLKRRAQTIRAWVNWILELTTDVYKENIFFD